MMIKVHEKPYEEMDLNMLMRNVMMEMRMMLMDAVQHEI